MKKLSSWQSYMQRHREQRLCTKCSNPAAGAGSLCDVCREKNRARAEANLNYRKANKLCMYCGKPLTTLDEGRLSHNRNDCKPSRRIRL